MNIQPLNIELAAIHRMKYGSEANIRTNLRLVEQKFARTGSDVDGLLVKMWRDILAEYVANQSDGDTVSIDPRNVATASEFSNVERHNISASLYEITGNNVLAEDVAFGAEAGSSAVSKFSYSLFMNSLIQAVPYYHYHAIIHSKLQEGYPVILTNIVDTAKQNTLIAQGDMAGESFGIFPLALGEESPVCFDKPFGGFLLKPDENGTVEVSMLLPGTEDLIDVERASFNLDTYSTCLNLSVNWATYRTVAQKCERYVSGTKMIKYAEGKSVQMKFVLPEIKEVNAPLRRNQKLGDPKFMGMHGGEVFLTPLKNLDFLNYNETMFFGYLVDRLASFSFMGHTPLTSMQFIGDDRNNEDKFMERGLLAAKYEGAWGTWVLPYGIEW